jgi:cytochrome c oxidase cbb3-type subunit 3
MNLLNPKVIVPIVLLACTSCEREKRNLRAPPPEVAFAQLVPTSDLRAGGPAAESFNLTGYEDTAYALSQGQQLYELFNCVGCHAHGGGGMGVPLIDDKWIYGSEPQQIFATIVQGRPKGMPSFRGRLTEKQVWELTAYVRSLSGMTPRQASSGREDHMRSAPPPNSVQPANPKNVSSPE